MEMVKNASIKEIVEFGLETIPEEKMVLVNVKDLIYIHQVLQEYMRFFHQPIHYSKIEDVENFLGNRKSGGGFEVLYNALYKKIDKMLPQEIIEMMNDSVFANPLYPKYYKNLNQ